MRTHEAPLRNLRRHLASHGYMLDESAEAVFRDVEIEAARINASVVTQLFLLALIRKLPLLRALMVRRELSPDDATLRLEGSLLQICDSYYDQAPYSASVHRNLGCRQLMVDAVMMVAQRRGRTAISAADVLEALMQTHDYMFPPTNNDEWSNEELQVAYNTLSHIEGCYDPDLWIMFDEVRRELGTLPSSHARTRRLDEKPGRRKESVLTSLVDQPHHLADCFIVMPLRPTANREQAAASVRRTLRPLGCNPMRADDKHQSDDLLSSRRNQTACRRR